ncbi:proline dehydrogenase family protein [Cryptosporangium arvum]|uniref:proline dehydrogenase n=1 Tax=Cryptosporangium arvum DSM 44712 TaxID=927661 RepID=A0A010YNB3_9ACTN|nr:proline dehydrogenase family protein [Cryptosporangium arvum]EXG81675.1 proline dehydrogenase [Cryptosporangium arvum DSM 44712]
MLSSALNRASRSRRVRRVVERVPVTRRVVDRFVAGEEIADVVLAGEYLRRQGRSVTIDVLGEDVTDAAGAAATTAAYLALLAALAEKNCAEGADVSLKLSALGQALPGSGDEIAESNARAVCEAAAAVGATVTLDMEDHTTVDSSLAIGAKLRVEYPLTGTVLQANLRRTERDLAELAQPGTRIRWVKGAYREPRSVAYQQKAEVDDAYRRGVRSLMESGCYPMIATHDPAMIEHALRAAARTGRSAADWEAQMLYGVSTGRQRELVEQGRRLRVYVPFGTDWYGYFMRRLAERPANVAFFLRALARG